MTGSYNLWLVVTSIVVACLASYVALDLASRVVAARGTRASGYWLGGGAVSMGTGIWSMHFLGMLAFELPIRMSYDIPITLLSLLIAIVVSGFALYTVSHGTLSLHRLLLGGLLMGFGIAGMHYTGMAAMQLRPAISYDLLLFGASILIAVGASMAALWIAFQLRTETILSAFRKKSASALVMGAAIAGMHYTGMASANFAPGTICTVRPQDINIAWLAGAVGGFTVLFLMATLVVSVFDASLSSRGAKHAENVRHMNEFLAMLSHELRNLLGPIVNALALMRKQPGQTHTELETLIERQVAHLTRMVDDLLDVSRITSGKVALKKEILDLNGVVARAVESCRALIDGRKQDLQLRLPDDPLPVDADATRLSQVIVNLLTNAAKYTPEKGVIAVSVSRDNDNAVVRVRDTGIGMSAALLPRVFDLYVQDHRALPRAGGGLGIGLTLVKQLVELHGGAVGASSEGAGRGSEFVIRLPLAIGREAALARVHETTPARIATGRRVLVVDDNRDFADTMSALLHSFGHDVRTVYDGPAALPAAAEYRPSIVLLDIGLPSMDGYEVARRLRNTRELAPVTIIAVTGYGQSEDRRRSREAGFDFHLVKPVELDELRKILDAVPAR